MNLQCPLTHCTSAFSAIKLGIRSIQGFARAEMHGRDFVTKLLDRKWALLNPDSKIEQIMFSVKDRKHRNGPLGGTFFFSNINPLLGNEMEENEDLSFYVVRDDLLHPLLNGNKSRKLDGLLPLLRDYSITDVVTCGGCQSAHTAAIAVSCAERGMISHLLLRGEQPDILTGYNLISTLYGNVTYVARSIYADREKMLNSHAYLLVGDSGHAMWCDDITDAFSRSSDMLIEDVHGTLDNHSRKVAIVNEGAGNAVALLGVIRLVNYLSQNHLFGKRRIKLVVDAGTGTTAIGLGLGALLLGLPWEITAIMLANTTDGYKREEKRLISDFKKRFGHYFLEDSLNEVDCGIVHWVERHRPRKFGNILEGEVQKCHEIAQNTGVLVDPIYTLAAWEMATLLVSEEKQVKGDAKVVMLHTGGTLGMFGLAQRYKSHFHNLNHANTTAPTS